MVDMGRGEAGVIFGEVDDGVFAGNVGGGDDRELAPRDDGIKGDRGYAATGEGAADGGSEPHVRQGDVVDVLGAAEYLGAPLFARGRVTDDFGGIGHG